MSQHRGSSVATSLPDALAGLPSPTGHPGRIADMSRDFGNAATELDDIGADLADVLRAVRGPWEGAAEHAFLNLLQPWAAHYRNAAKGYREAAGALKQYAAALAHAQEAFTSARQIAETDWSRQTGPGHSGPLDPFSPDRVRARRLLEVALEQLRAATVRASAVLKALESHLARRPPVKPEIYRSNGDSAMQGGAEVWEKVRADARGLWEMHRLVTPGQAKQAWQQTWDENVDELDRLMTNPLKYAADEAYEIGNVEELVAGNNARWAAGLAYNVATRLPNKLSKFFSPDGRRDQDDERRDN